MVLSLCKRSPIHQHREFQRTVERFAWEFEEEARLQLYHGYEDGGGGQVHLGPGKWHLVPPPPPGAASLLTLTKFRISEQPAAKD